VGKFSKWLRALERQATVSSTFLTVNSYTSNDEYYDCLTGNDNGITQMPNHWKTSCGHLVYIEPP